MQDPVESPLSAAAVLPVLVWPEPALTTAAAAVTHFNAQLQEFVRSLFATMYASNGIGLAANQVGVLQRVLVIDLDPDKQRDADSEWNETLNDWGYTGPVAVINPRITGHDGEITYEEGCLSVPGVQIEIQRRDNITVQAVDLHGKPVQLRAAGLYAVALQHEMDHLDGKVFVDYVEASLREEIRQQMLQRPTAGEPAPQAL